MSIDDCRMLWRHSGGELFGGRWFFQIFFLSFDAGTNPKYFDLRNVCVSYPGGVADVQSLNKSLKQEAIMDNAEILNSFCVSMFFPCHWFFSWIPFQGYFMAIRTFMSNFFLMNPESLEKAIKSGCYRFHSTKVRVPWLIDDTKAWQSDLIILSQKLTEWKLQTNLKWNLWSGRL